MIYLDSVREKYSYVHGVIYMEPFLQTRERQDWS